MSNDTLTIKIKIGDSEIEVSGSSEHVSKTLENLPEIVNNVSLFFNTIKFTTTTNSVKRDPVRTTKDELPTITAHIGISCPEAIITILSSKWGREKPRNLGELMEAMKVNALHFPKGTIKGRLTDLTKKGILRRIKGNKGYSYIVVK